MLIELVRGGGFRPDRHLGLFWSDSSLFNALDEHYEGRVEWPEAEFLRLSWCYWWQTRLLRREVTEELALFRFREALRGVHPSIEPPWERDDE